AVEAGADVLMMPLDPPGAIDAICAAVESGRLTEARIQASLERIWRAKQRIFTLEILETDAHGHAWEQRPPAPIRLDDLAQPAALETAASILMQSAQFRGIVPKCESAGHNIIVVDDLIGCDTLNRKAPALVMPQQCGYTELTLVDGRCPIEPEAWIKANPAPALLQLFIRGNPFRGSAGLNQRAQDWFEALLHSGQLQGLALYGSPYILDTFLPLLPPTLPFGFAYGQMPMAQGIVLDRLLEGLPN
ncbi:MAG TPA: beta-glucosidase, partial [Stenomitos sp.]